MILEKSLVELQKLYSESPDVPCTKCGLCCVSPHMSFLEFVYFFDGLVETHTHEKIGEILATAPEDSKLFEGNLHCSMQEGLLCSNWLHRSLSCRMEGLHAVDELFNRSEPICPVEEVVDQARHVTISTVEELSNRLVALNRSFYPFLEPPYYLDALNIECWFAVILDPEITQPFFLSMRALVDERHDLAPYKPFYVNHTGLSSKITLIEQFDQLYRNKNYFDAGKVLSRIQSGYPNTGTYFHFQSQHFEYELRSKLSGSGIGEVS